MHGKRLPEAAPSTPAAADRKLTPRQQILSFLALRYGRSRKAIGDRSGLDHKRVSKHLKLRRQKELEDDLYEQLLATMRPMSEAALPVVTACVEALDALDGEGPLSPQERAAIETEVLTFSRRLRQGLAQAVGLSRRTPADGYPAPRDLAPARRRAEKQFRRLLGEAPEDRPAALRASRACHTWALCERLCTASVEGAAQDLEAAAAWARLAVEVAALARVPPWFHPRLRAYAAAHAANVLRVQGELNAADAAFTEAERLWHAGSDPAAVLDPGRILDLKASLRRDQRRPREALALLDEALAVGRSPERALVNKGFTLEVMGDYERAAETLLEALPRAERSGDRRLLYLARFNLAVIYTHLGFHDAAAALLPEVQELARELGDAIFLLRVPWLEGRIFAGLGRPQDALLHLAEARRQFRQWGMSYDAALALLEEAVLLLREGRAAEVRPLARELAEVFQDKGVEREALAALTLFREAAEREEATAELTRRLLRFLFLARHDPDLRFDS